MNKNLMLEALKVRKLPYVGFYNKNRARSADVIVTDNGFKVLFEGARTPYWFGSKDNVVMEQFIAECDAVESGRSYDWEVGV